MGRVYRLVGTGEQREEWQMIDRLNAMIVSAALSASDGVRNRLRREEGQAFVEYALVITLVAVAVALLAQWTNLTTAIHDSLQKVIDALKSAGK